MIALVFKNKSRFIRNRRLCKLQYEKVYLCNNKLKQVFVGDARNVVRETGRPRQRQWLGRSINSYRCQDASLRSIYCRWCDYNLDNVDFYRPRSHRSPLILIHVGIWIKQFETKRFYLTLSITSYLQIIS